jgi:hypothetical protein
MLVATILIIGAVGALFYVDRLEAKLGIIAGFTALFALSVAFLTTATRSEIYATTAAYTAVLVVFISGNVGSTPVPSFTVVVPSGLAGTVTAIASPT